MAKVPFSTRTLKEEEVRQEIQETLLELRGALQSVPRLPYNSSVFGARDNYANAKLTLDRLSTWPAPAALSAPGAISCI